MYLGTNGRKLTAERTLTRLNDLAIPPAWQSVWICASPAGHLQATGIDAKGRKQYLYHSGWAALRSTRKYLQLADFGATLPALRRRLRADLKAPEGSLECSLAALVCLLDRAHLRIGSRRHLRSSGTFGASTLLGRHVSFQADGTLHLQFRGKGGRMVERKLRDRRLHQVLQKIDDLPGRRLFSWVDEQGKICPVTSQQINAYIAATCGIPGATAKTFRTWAGSVAAMECLTREPESASVKAVSEAAAQRLHNTPAICRSSYIHPQLIDLARAEPEQWPVILRRAAPAKPAGLSVGERRLLRLLKLP